MDCCKTFNSQISYYYNEELKKYERINIEDYNGEIICCKNKHKLCFVNSGNRIKHFRHVINDDNYNNIWHKSFQEKFDNIEVYYKKKSNSFSSRNADIVCNNNIIELQHSSIKKNEINNRNHDYGLYNLEVIWIIDGNTSIIIKELKDTYLLIFKNCLWKFESFIDCEYIYIDIEDKIFKVIPKYVKSNMIQVIEYIKKDKFIKDIKTNKLKWKKYNIPQTILYHNQRGAGCGKTYESIQLLASKEEFQEKTLFIYLTKIHSAKDVIYNEFKEQIKDNKIIPDEFIDNKNGNQYKIDININKRNLEIIIGTIDSYIYALGDKSQNGMNYFSKLLNSIKNGYNDDIEKNGNIKYSRGKYKMNKECLIIIDEAQDLEIDYIEAIVEIMKNTYIDVYLIGDKLQSIWFSKNVYTYLENNELPNIKIIKNTGENVVRRFHNNQYIDFVNNIIDFKKFKLPKITGCCDGNCKYKHENNIKPYYISRQPTIYSNDYDISKVDKYLKDIIGRIEEKVHEYYYLPHNFMFIFPIMKNNYLAMRLKTSLNEYWMKQFLNKDYQEKVLINDEYWKDNIEDINNGKAFEYSFIHKSDGNKPINLNESKYSTKLLSIHSSKGLGCEVIFLLNLNQISLEILCKDDNEEKIIYNSLLHVAITRQKKFIYIGIDNDNQEDNIYKRFYNLFDDKYEDERLNIKNNIKVDNLIQYINNEDEKILTKDINFDELIKKDNNKEEITCYYSFSCER